jgi:polyhydroxyalkanoate synthesis regulator phasin
LGVADPVVAQAASTAATGAGIALSIPAIAAAAGPAAPFILAGFAIAALISRYIGGGCGPVCTEAAQVEQVYEAAADNALQMVKLGFVTPAEAVAFMQGLIYDAQQREAQFGTKQSTAGAQNAASVIQAEIADVQAVSPVGLVPIDLNVAHQHYVTGNWYPASEAAGAQLTDQWLNAVAANYASQVRGPASPSAGQAVFSSPGAPASSTGGIPDWLIIAALGFAAWKLL